MPRVGTSNLNLGTFLDGEYPGAGSQSVDNDGLNGNMIKIDRAIGTEHNADGSHKANVIKGSNLVQAGGDAVVDGVTIEFNANKVRVKDAGITYAKIQNISATNKLLGRKTVGAGVTEEIGIDGSTIEIHATNGLQVKDAGIPAAKLAADAVETAKIKNSNVTTEKLEYKEIVIVLSQAGTADPSMTIIKNTSGFTLYATRSSQGVYVINDGEGGHIFTTGKCVAVHSGIPNGVASTTFSTDISIVINTKDFAGVSTDSLLSGFSLIVRIYP